MLDGLQVLLLRCRSCCSKIWCCHAEVDAELQGLML
jgi:hypothetical protein